MLRGFFEVRPRDFYANRAEYVRAFWIGAGYGWVDPVKEVESSKLAIDWGLSTYADEGAAQGQDWEEMLQQRKREEDRIKEFLLKLSGIFIEYISDSDLEWGEPTGKFSGFDVRY